MSEVERVSAVSISELGLSGPDTVPCQSVRYQIATKLHAVTERFDDRENDRFRDLIDIILLRDVAPDLSRLGDACLDVFNTRNKHSWPPELTVEPSWPDGYRALAAEQEFEPSEVDQAIAAVSGLISDVAEPTR